MQYQPWKFVCMRVSSRFVIGLAVAMSVVAPLPATTLQQLTLEDMAHQSTAIVRARVTGSRSAGSGADIYTYFQLQVVETWKASGQAPTEVAVPGGVFNGIRQTVTGAPELKAGQEYVLFLWTSRSGLTQVIGLSQGVFKVSEEGSGGEVAMRPAASELMLNSSGSPVEDRPVSIQLQDLRSRVRKALGTRK
jgi:hypothetical protein